MKKLKNKTFWVIFSILTIFLASILCIFNYQDYVHEKKEIENNLMRAQETRDEQFRPDNKPEKMENQNNEEKGEINGK